MSVIWVGRERLCFLLLGAVEASGGKKVDLALYWRPLVAPLPVCVKFDQWCSDIPNTVEIQYYITSYLCGNRQIFKEGYVCQNIVD